MRTMNSGDGKTAQTRARVHALPQWLMAPEPHPCDTSQRLASIVIPHAPRVSLLIPPVHSFFHLSPPRARVYFMDAFPPSLLLHLLRERVMFWCVSEIFTPCGPRRHEISASCAAAGSRTHTRAFVTKTHSQDTCKQTVRWHSRSEAPWHWQGVLGWRNMTGIAWYHYRAVTRVTNTTQIHRNTLCTLGLRHHFICWSHKQCSKSFFFLMINRTFLQNPARLVFSPVEDSHFSHWQRTTQITCLENSKYYKSRAVIRDVQLCVLFSGLRSSNLHPKR